MTLCFCVCVCVRACVYLLTFWTKDKEDPPKGLDPEILLFSEKKENNNKHFNSLECVFLFNTYIK